MASGVEVCNQHFARSILHAIGYQRLILFAMLALLLLIMTSLILASIGASGNGVLLIDNRFDKEVEVLLIVLADITN